MPKVAPECPEGLRELPMGASTLLPPLMPVELCFHRNQAYPLALVSEFLKVTPVSETTATPVYYSYKRVEKDGRPYIAIYYVCFYDVNPGYVPPCLPCMYCLPQSKYIGYHPADVERFVVLFDPASLQPKWVFFGAHGGGHGTWRAWEQCNKAADGVLRAYVSYKSHGFYPGPGIWWRAWGTINDVCGNARAWRPEAKDFLDAGKQTWSESHYQVAKGINSPYNAVDPDTRGITNWERFNLALPWVRKRIASPKIPVHERLAAEGVSLQPLVQAQMSKGAVL